MQLRGKLTQPEFDDVLKLARTRMYWPKVIMRSFYGIVLVVAVLVGTFSGLQSGIKPHWGTIGTVWAGVAGTIAWVFFRNKRARRQQFSKLNLTLPDQIALADDGVKSDGPDGATSLLPWRSFKGWREGKKVILVDRAQGKNFVILPTAEMHEVERETLRRYLQSHISTESQVPSIANLPLQPE